MVLSARGMRSNSRDRGDNDRGDGRDKPARNKSEKRIPLKQKISDAEAEIARINGIISKIDTALALPDLFKRDPKQAAQLGKARAGAAERAAARRGRMAGGKLAIRSGDGLSWFTAGSQSARNSDQVAAGFFFGLRRSRPAPPVRRRARSSSGVPR